MFWTVANFLFRVIEVLTLLICLPFIYFLVKESISDMRAYKTCKNCDRVSVNVWACHSNREYCINCCGCPDHIDTTHPYLHCFTAPANTWCGNCAETD